MLYKMGIWVRSKSCTTKSRKLVQDGFIVPGADHNTQGVESCTRWTVGRCLLIVELTWYTRSARWCTKWRKVGGQQRQWWARREWMGWWYLLASDQPDLPTCHPVMAFRSSYLPSSSSPSSYLPSSSSSSSYLPSSSSLSLPTYGIKMRASLQIHLNLIQNWMHACSNVRMNQINQRGCKRSTCLLGNEEVISLKTESNPSGDGSNAHMNDINELHQTLDIIIISWINVKRFRFQPWLGEQGSHKKKHWHSQIGNVHPTLWGLIK